VTQPPPDDPGWGVRRTSFGSQADAYARGRPPYPLEAIEWVLPAGARRVLDLAAGTGRLTERLLEVGLDVVAVEPLAEMRAHLPAGAQRLDGTAEALPLDDRSVDAVVVGQAFHWFDVPVAMAEIRRVLRLAGTVGLFWNMLDDSEPWIDRLATILVAEERASFLRNEQDAPYAGIDGMSAPERRLFRHAPIYDVERLVAFVHSRSQTILMPESERHVMIEAVRDVVPAGEFPLPLICEAWRGLRQA
jgi:SAM-dependent methyltransferase